MSSHFESEWFEYSPDGDKVDRRDKIIRKLQCKIGEMEQKERNEYLLRQSHPGLQEAWEKYQTLLLLINQGSL